MLSTIDDFKLAVSSQSGCFVHYKYGDIILPYSKGLCTPEILKCYCSQQNYLYVTSKCLYVDNIFVVYHYVFKCVYHQRAPLYRLYSK